MGKINTNYNIDLVNRRFVKLKVINAQDSSSLNSKKIWECVCDCGASKTVASYDLITGRTRSCGCLKRDALSKRSTKDIKGQKFTRLLVLEQFRENDRTKCRVKCDCGKIKIVNRQELVKGGTKSCGCYSRELFLTNIVEKSLLPGDERYENELISNYNCAAKVRGLVFSLTRKESITLFKGNCFYCGIEPKQHLKSRTRPGNGYFYNGIDRLDSSVGYTLDNTVSCCAPCNFAKSDKKFTDFIYWIIKLSNHILDPSTEVYKKYSSLKFNKKISFHELPIRKGIYGEISKIQEEVDEAIDSSVRGHRVMLLLELADIIGAIDGMLLKQFPEFTTEDLLKFVRLRGLVSVTEGWSSK